VLGGGVLQQYGPPADLYARPVNLFTARFIGSPEMNLYAAAVDADGALLLGSQRLPYGAPRGQDRVPARPGEPVIVGIRPEDLALGAPGDPATLTAQVMAIEQLGTELHAFFSIDAAAAPGASGAPLAGAAAGTGLAGNALAGNAQSGNALAGVALAGVAAETAADADAMLPGQAHNGVARLDPRCGVRPGTRITLRVDTARLYFFDPATGSAVGWPSAPDTRPAAPSATPAAAANAANAGPSG
jgi:multiple sugar transport system ATP-binding protein